jgi:hypothetical protein
MLDSDDEDFIPSQQSVSSDDAEYVASPSTSREMRPNGI